MMTSDHSMPLPTREIGEEMAALFTRIEADLMANPTYASALERLKEILGGTASTAEQVLAPLRRAAMLEALNHSHRPELRDDRAAALPSVLTASEVDTLPEAWLRPGAVAVWPDDRGATMAADLVGAIADPLDDDANNPFYEPLLLGDICDDYVLQDGVTSPELLDFLGNSGRIDRLIMPPPRADWGKIDPEWEAEVKTLGLELRRERHRQGLTLYALHGRTRVPLHHLASLESGRTNLLPEPIYVRGFVRRIGDALGYDGRALADRLPWIEDGVLPSWAMHQDSTLPIEIQPWHLYVGYAAVVAGGIAWMTQTAPQPAGAIQPLAPQPASSVSMDGNAATAAIADALDEGPVSAPVPMATP